MGERRHAIPTAAAARQQRREKHEHEGEKGQRKIVPGRMGHDSSIKSIVQRLSGSPSHTVACR